MATVTISAEQDTALTALPSLQLVIAAKKYNPASVLATELCAAFVERLDSPRAVDQLDQQQWTQMREAVLDRVPLNPKITANRQYAAALERLGQDSTLSKLFCIYLPLSSSVWTDYWDTARDGPIDPHLGRAVSAMHKQFEGLDPDLLNAVADSIRTQMSVV
jgi:hypothetical protein